MCDINYLKKVIRSQNSWNKMTVKSVTHINDKNLCDLFTNISMLITNKLKDNKITLSVITDNTFHFPTLMTLKYNKPEYCIKYGQLLLLGSEATDVDEGLITCSIQALQNCGDNLIHMKQIGIPIEECVMLGCLCYNEIFHYNINKLT